MRRSFGLSRHRMAAIAAGAIATASALATANDSPQCRSITLDDSTAAALAKSITSVLLARQCNSKQPVAQSAADDAAEAIPVWPGHANPVMRVTRPPHSAVKLKAPAMVIFRGGGYNTCAGSGGEMMAWAAAHGMVGIEVEYSAVIGGQPPAGGEHAKRRDIVRRDLLHPLPEGAAAFPQCTHDAARAVRLVRHLATQGSLPIDPSRVIVCGFSAGGHLASLLATQWDADFMRAEADDLCHISCRPDRAVLCYPLTSLLAEDDTLIAPNGQTTLAACQDNLLGTRHAELADVKKRLSSPHHVKADTPPIFLWTTADDTVVPFEHSTRLFAAARAKKVPAELHVYADAVGGGEHGQGLAAGNPSLEGWASALLAWLGTEFTPA